MKSATIPNPALQPLNILIGDWQTTGTHPIFPGVTVRGTARFEWIEGGAFMKLSSKLDHPDFPAGVAIFGSDVDSGDMTILYFDSREVSRIQHFSIVGKQWRWWRDEPKFSQRFTVTISDDGDTMTGKGEMCRDGTMWEPDLNLTYRRVASAVAEHK